MSLQKDSEPMLREHLENSALTLLKTIVRATSHLFVIETVAQHFFLTE